MEGPYADAFAAQHLVESGAHLRGEMGQFGSQNSCFVRFLVGIVRGGRALLSEGEDELLPVIALTVRRGKLFALIWRCVGREHLALRVLGRAKGLTVVWFKANSSHLFTMLDIHVLPAKIHHSSQTLESR